MSVGNRETLVFPLKFLSRDLLASFSGQAAGDWHSGCMSLGPGDSIFAVVKAKVKVPCAPLAPRLCPKNGRRGLAVPAPSWGLARSVVRRRGPGPGSQRCLHLESDRFEKPLVRAATWGSDRLTSHLPVLKCLNVKTQITVFIKEGHPYPPPPGVVKIK